MTGIHKPRRQGDPEYLEWVRGMHCLVGHGCMGDIHPHHLRRQGAGGSDYTAIPLCALHHSVIHNVGEHTASERYVIDWGMAALSMVIRWFVNEKGGTHGREEKS